MDQAVDVLVAIVLACIPIVVPFLLKLVTAKVGEHTMYKAQVIAKTAVEAAEMIGATTGLTSEDKKAYAKNVVASALKLKPEQLDAIIEAAVKQMRAYGTELKSGE